MYDLLAEWQNIERDLTNRVEDLESEIEVLKLDRQIIAGILNSLWDDIQASAPFGPTVGPFRVQYGAKLLPLPSSKTLPVGLEELHKTLARINEALNAHC